MPERGNVFITGATSGIGKACAVHLSELGYRVYGASRSAPSVEDVSMPSAFLQAESHHGTMAATSKRAADASTLPYTLFRMDVRDQSSVERGISFLLEREGNIDVVINNAGISVAGPIEEMTIDEIRDQLETNFMGVLHTCKAVLPAMREQRRGLIINIGSIAGIMAVPFQPIYSACKFAVEGFSEALQIEAQPFGIRVVVVEPGDTRTGFTANRQDSAGISDSSAYADRFRRIMAAAAKSEMEGWTAERVAKTIGKIVQSRHPRFRYKPAMLVQRIAPAARKIIPDRLFLRILAKFFNG